MVTINPRSELRRRLESLTEDAEIASIMSAVKHADHQLKTIMNTARIIEGAKDGQ